MKSPLLTILTVLNLVLLGFLLLQNTTRVVADDKDQILRGKGLQIVDDAGKVRASITLHPAQYHEQSKTHYPETVVLRLIDENGRPEIKIAASKDGGGYTCIGETDGTQAMMHAMKGAAFVKVQDSEESVKYVRSEGAK
jgi:hypothetical protein